MKKLLVLAILVVGCGAPSADDPPTSEITQGLSVSNGSFETGDYTGWTVQHSTPSGTFGTWGIASNNQTIAAGASVHDFVTNTDISESSPGLPTTYHSTDGNELAILLENGGEDHRMFQTITVPSCSAVVKWDMAYNNHENSFDTTGQFLALNIRNPSTDAILSTPYRTTQGVDPEVLSAMTGFVADISSFAGQTVRLDYEAEVTEFFFDIAFDNIRVLCRGLSPDLSPIAFGNVAVGNTSTLTTTITNEANTTITISQVQLAGDADLSLVAQPGVPDALAPGATAQVSVKFAPTSGGAASGVLTVVSDDPNGNLSIPITGFGNALQVSPPSLTFATTQVGDTSPTQPVTIKNLGASSLTVDSASIAAPFQVALATPVTIGPGLTATANVAFAPTAAGPASASLQVHATDGETGSVACSGTGQSATISVSTPPAFSPQRVGTQSGTLPVIVTNTGVDNVTLSSFAVTAPFVIVTAPGTPDVLAPNGTAEIDVAFAPTTAGPATGTLTITSTAQSSPDRVTLSGTGIAPVISAQPVAFGNQHVNTTGNAQLFVTNNGTDTLNVSSITGTAPFSASITPTAIAPGDTQPFTVSFTPPTENPFTGTFTITSDDPVTPSLQVGASGNGVLGHVAIAPGSVNFNTQRRGTTSAPQTVTITNTGTDTLNITSATLPSGPFAGALGPTSLAPNAFVQFQVTFTPAVDGPASATLSVVSDAPTSPDTIGVTGIGVEPIATPSPASLAFGNQRVATTSPSKQVTITNTGTSALTISAATASGPFAVASPALPATVGINQQATFQVTFSPTATGAASGSLAFTTDAASSPTVPLTGTGTAPDIAAAPATLAFGNQRIDTASAAQPITVTNTGTASLAISAVTAPAGYAVAGALPQTLLPNAQATFQITFSPTALGADDGSVTITSDAASSPTHVAVTGAGVQAVAAVSPGAQDFGQVRVGSTGGALPFSITNTGNDAFVVKTISVPAPFVLVSGPALPATVAANGALPLSIAFAPTAVGPAAGTLLVATDDGFTSASLTGQGVASAIDPSLDPIDFGSVSIKTTQTLALQLDNPGTASLTITSLSLGGANAADFALAPPPTLPAVVAPGDALTVTVAFTPSAHGARAAQLVAASDAFGTASLTIPLTGRGIGAHVVLTPDTLDFGSTNVGSASPPRSVTVANTGDDTLVVSAIVLGGADGADFTEAQALPLTIGAGSSAAVAFQFVPTAGGERTATATFTTSDPFAPTTALALDGGGQTPTVTATPNQLAFGDVRVGSGASLPLQLSNTGSGELTIAGLVIDGAEATEFVLDAIALPLVLEPGGSANLHVNYDPTVVASESAQLEVTSDDPNDADLVVPLSGIGVSPTVDVAPASIDFGGQLVGRTSAPRQVTVTNTGTGNLAITSLAISGATSAVFALVKPPSLPFTIAAGKSLVLSVTVAPTMIAADGADLAVGTDTSDATVHLTSLGISTAMSVSPSSIDFGTTHPGAATAPVAVTISNLSSDPISLLDATVAGATPGDFTVTSVAGAIPAGGSATAMVTYDPAAPATSLATLDFATQDSAIPDALVSVDGHGLAAFVVVDHGALDFGSIEVGGESGTRTVTIKNVATAPVTIASVTSSDPQFAVDASAITGPLQPGATATFTVTFGPTAEGSASSTAAITLAGATGPEVTVALTGTGASRPSTGGCSTSGGDGGAGAILMMLAVGAIRRRHQRGTS